MDPSRSDSKEERIWHDKNELWMEAVNRRHDDEHARSSDAEEQNMLLWRRQLHKNHNDVRTS